MSSFSAVRFPTDVYQSSILKSELKYEMPFAPQRDGIAPNLNLHSSNGHDEYAREAPSARQTSNVILHILNI